MSQRPLPRHRAHGMDMDMDMDGTISTREGTQGTTLGEAAPSSVERARFPFAVYQRGGISAGDMRACTCTCNMCMHMNAASEGRGRLREQMGRDNKVSKAPEHKSVRGPAKCKQEVPKGVQLVRCPSVMFATFAIAVSTLYSGRRRSLALCGPSREG